MNTIFGALYTFILEIRNFPDSEEYRKQFDILHTKKENLLGLLEDKEKELLLDLIENTEELESIAGETQFREGFKLGFQLYEELFKEK